MGWTSSNSWRTVNDVVREYTSPEAFVPGVKLVDFKLKAEGSGTFALWLLVDIDPAAGHPASGLVILLDLISNEGGGLAVKQMDESMHPYYYTCPVSFLNRAPVRSEAWRAGVLARRAA